MNDSKMISLLLIIIIFASTAKCELFCGNQTYFREPKGKIETSFESANDLVNCSWSIITPKKSVVFIKIEYLQLGSYDEKYKNKENCLSITSLDKKFEFMKLCIDVTYFDSVSVPTNELLVNLEMTSESYLSLTYATYIVNCSYNEVKCYNSRYFPKNSGKKCTDGMLVCDGFCRYGTVKCGDFCYDIQKQRCNGIIDCPTAEDELGCVPDECPNQIRCSNETKCITSQQICDGNLDCKNEFDESNCSKFSCKEEANCNIERSREKNQEEEDLTYIITVILAIMVLLFIYLICKCISRRDNVRNMLDNQLDVPLPPFRGPGESSLEDDTNDDCHPEGDIYESFTANIEKIKNKRKGKMEDDEKNITFVKPPEGQDTFNKFFNGLKPVLSEEMAALATLKISRDMCRGLKKAKSEERPITRLLFIDSRDDDDVSDDDSVEEDKATCSNNKKAAYRPTYSKSDTDYIRRKSAGPSFV